MGDQPALACSANLIFNHIAHNKGDDRITDKLVIKAIRMLQDKALELGMITKEDCQHMERNGR